MSNWVREGLDSIDLELPHGETTVMLKFGFATADEAAVFRDDIARSLRAGCIVIKLDDKLVFETGAGDG